jgi:hypothetical protein
LAFLCVREKSSFSNVNVRNLTDNRLYAVNRHVLHYFRAAFDFGKIRQCLRADFIN